MSGFAELSPSAHPKSEQVPDLPPPRKILGRDVYVFGAAGPPVFTLHELPGFTPKFIHFCRALSGKGFTVYAPLLFGKAGETATKRNLLRASFSRDWYVLKNATPRIIDELRRTADTIQAETRVPMGAIGMCFTGQLPVALLDRKYIQAAVLSQPSMPFGNKKGLGLDDGDVAAAKQSEVRMIAFRFDTDETSPPQRQAAFEKEFGKQIEFRALPAKGKQHAVLTEHLFDGQGNMLIGTPAAEAFEETRDYLRSRLSK